jgi:malonyl CoA-acyl carrier protein transacylase
LPSVRARHLQRAGTGLSGAAPWRPGGTRRVRCPARGRGAPTLSELDGAAKFSPALHTRGDIAAPLIYAASYLDFLSIDRDRFEVVAVTGNSMGWYTALACAGAVSGEHGFAIADAMGVNSQKHAPGGQAVLVLAGEDWRVDPALRRAVDAAMARHGVLPSIHLGGMLVVAGSKAALDALERTCPACRVRPCALLATARSTRR